MADWMTAPAGLYTFDAATGLAVPILAVDADGFGLMPGGRTTKQIYMVGAPKGDPKDPDRHRDGYLQAVRDNRDGDCAHGDPRGPRYCALCRVAAAM